MSDSVSVILRGKAFYPKILELVPNYSRDGYEWTMDFMPCDEDLGKFKGLGILDRLKRREGSVIPGQYITLKQREKKTNGDANKPPKVKDINGKDWDKDTKIGNGSDVDVKINIVDYGKGKKKGIYLNAVRVLSLVPYTGGSDFPALTPEDEFFASDVDVKIDANDVDFNSDLEDDLPF